jgi:uncharacterized damage-inducible protein DinB
MPERRVWTAREFELGMPSEALPDLIERLRGTPARVEERIDGVPTSQLTGGDDPGWSILRNVGHLLDLEPLWAGRVDDFEAERTELRPADMSNAATNSANHDSQLPAYLLQKFRNERSALVKQYEGFSDSLIERTAFHPRLRKQMSVVDLAHFIAEHDDHHLARISEILKS